MARAPYQVFYENLNRLYNAFKAVFGGGGGGFLRVLFSMIIRKGAIDASSSDEVITFMRRNDENARKALLKMFRPDWV